jgi:spermidine synthase
MKTLKEIYESHQNKEHYGDKGTTHTYIDVYEDILSKYRENSTVLEVGVFYGHSLRMWNQFFINSKIIGVDITDAYLGELINEGKYNIIIADATNQSFLNKVDDTFDVIIDDGSHQLRDQIKTFNLLKNKMNSGGLYVIEDIPDLDNDINIYKDLHENIEIIDNRHIKGRFDDVLILYKF